MEDSVVFCFEQSASGLSIGILRWGMLNIYDVGRMCGTVPTRRWCGRLCRSRMETWTLRLPERFTSGETVICDALHIHETPPVLKQRVYALHIAATGAPMVVCSSPGSYSNCENVSIFCNSTYLVRGYMIRQYIQYDAVMQADIHHVWITLTNSTESNTCSTEAFPDIYQ